MILKKILVYTILFSFLFLNQVQASGEEPSLVSQEQTEEVTVINENTTKVTNKYFDLVLIKKNQSAFGKDVPYVLQITPHLSSPKTQILWDSPNTLSVSPKHKEFLSMEEGKTYTVKANVKPLRYGTYDFTVSVISWQYDTNYTNAASDTLTFDKGLVLQPTSAEYQITNVIKYIVIVALFGLVCFGVVKMSKQYSKKAKQWLTPPY
ncbi:MAG: hypothetical protein AB9915_02620 [Candidatus Dojkabacteria bacterium]